MKKNIGLFFGSFNPVHVGHLIIANYMVEHTLMDEVWMIVSPHSPFKKITELASEKDRLKMVKISLTNHCKIKVSNIEFKLSKPSYSINTLQQLAKKFPNITFSIIMGSDNLKGLLTWKKAKIIIRDYKVFVYKRSGYHLGKLKKHKNICFVNAPLLNISSTYIRNQIEEKKKITFLVSSNVEYYIVKNNLYSK